MNSTIKIKFLFTFPKLIKRLSLLKSFFSNVHSWIICKVKYFFKFWLSNWRVIHVFSYFVFYIGLIRIEIIRNLRNFYHWRLMLLLFIIMLTFNNISQNLILLIFISDGFLWLHVLKSLCFLLSILKSSIIIILWAFNVINLVFIVTCI